MKLIGKVEIAANVCIILLAVTFGGLLIRRYMSPARPAIAGRGDVVPPNQIHGGIKLDLPDVNWRENDNTLILALSKGCGYCEASAPFYKRVMDFTAGKKHLKVMAVLPQETDESRKYLEEKLGVSVAEIKQASLAKLGVVGTPTLVLVNGDGVVTDYWLGKLQSDREQEVIAKLQQIVGETEANLRDGGEANHAKHNPGPDSQPVGDYVDNEQINKEVRAGRGPVVVDIRERPQYAADHYQGAKNIPMTELEVRASDELPKDSLIVLSCRCPDDSMLRMARQLLESQGFRVKLLKES